MGTITTVTVEIVKKGRKYFKAQYPGKTFEIDVVINDGSKDFAVGQTVSFRALVDSKSSGYGTKTTLTPVTAEIAAQETRKEIVRWLEFVEERAQSGSVYQKGLDTLRSLGIRSYPDLLERQEAALNLLREHQAKRDAAYQSQKAAWAADKEAEAQARELRKQNRVFCPLGGLPKLNTPVVVEDMAVVVESYGKTFESGGQDGCYCYYRKATGVEAESATAAPAATTETAAAKVEVFQFDSDRQRNVPSARGDVFSRDGSWYTATKVSSRYFREDGLSFGLGDDSGTLVTVQARLATPEEAAPKIAEKQVAEDARKAAQARANERGALETAIREQGTRPEGHRAGKQLLSTVSPYGGGDWFEVDEAAKEIWYCKNNGADGDDWSHNNVGTWGAGAIGWRIDYDPEIARRILALVEAK